MRKSLFDFFRFFLIGFIGWCHPIYSYHMFLQQEIISDDMTKLIMTPRQAWEYVRDRQTQQLIGLDYMDYLPYITEGEISEVITLIYIKKVLLLFACAFGLTTAAQTSVIDSIDVSDIDTIEVVDTIDCSKLETPSIPQIPFEELDSLTIISLDDRYVEVYKDGKCGIYDLLKEENVTRVEYGYLRFSFRKEMEGELYTYFSWEEEKTLGVIGIAEVNQFISIAMPKKEEDDTE